MKAKKLDLIVIGVCVASLAALAVVYPRMPRTIPVHWNFKSEVDGWGPSWTILFMGALPLAIYLLLKIVPRLDPRKDAYEKHAKPYTILTTVLSLVFIPIAWIVAIAAFGIDFPVDVFVRIIIGVLFVVVGNFLGKFRPNYFVGIRTPWTLSDPEVWKKTHRHGAWVFIIMGLCMLASILLPHSAAAAIVVLVSIIGGVIYLFAYSYLVWRKSRDT